MKNGSGQTTNKQPNGRMSGDQRHKLIASHSEPVCSHDGFNKVRIGFGDFGVGAMVGRTDGQTLLNRDAKTH